MAEVLSEALAIAAAVWRSSQNSPLLIGKIGRASSIETHFDSPATLLAMRVDRHNAAHNGELTLELRLASVVTRSLAQRRFGSRGQPVGVAGDLHSARWTERILEPRHRQPRLGSRGRIGHRLGGPDVCVADRRIYLKTR